MFCPKCGVTNSADSKFCWQCSYELPLLRANINSPKDSMTSTISTHKPPRTNQRKASVNPPALLLNNSASLRYGAVGLPTKVRAMLFNDHVELHDKRGNILLDTPLSNLTDIRIKWFSMVTFTADGQYYSIDFTPLTRRAAFSAFGVVGSLVGEAINPAKDTAQTWLSTVNRISINS